MNTHSHTNDHGGNPADDRPAAVRHADAGTTAWRAAVREQRDTTPDHADFYSLAGEIVTTLHALQDLAVVLGHQVEDYRRRRDLYDDAGADPLVRLADAADELHALAASLTGPIRDVDRFWSAIGHIGTTSPTTGTTTSAASDKETDR